MESDTGSSGLPARLRAFIALGISPEVERAIDSFVAGVRSPRDGVRWVRPTNLHLTLRFLGDAVDSRMIAPLSDGLGALAAAVAPFLVQARGVGAFPNLTRPRVIWVGLESAELTGLAARVEAVVVEAGFAAERRPYSPHLTIGRVRAPARFGTARRALERAADRDFGCSEIREMILYRSILSPAGSTYHGIRHFALGVTR